MPEQFTEKLRALEDKLYACQYAQAVMSYDEATAAPARSEDGRARAAEMLSRISFDALVNPETEALLKEAEAADLDELTAAEVRELRRRYDEIARIPPMGSSPTDAVGSVPNEEIARIGPGGGKPRDALELLETLFLQRPPCDCEEYAEWYRYKLKRDHGYDLDYDDEGNEVIIGRTGE